MRNKIFELVISASQDVVHKRLSYSLGTELRDFTKILTFFSMMVIRAQKFYVSWKREYLLYCELMSPSVKEFRSTTSNPIKISITNHIKKGPIVVWTRLATFKWESLIPLQLQLNIPQLYHSFHEMTTLEASVGSISREFARKSSSKMFWRGITSMLKLVDRARMEMILKKTWRVFGKWQHISPWKITMHFSWIKKNDWYEKMKKWY